MIGGEARHVETAEIIAPRWAVALARSDLHHGDIVKLLIAEGRAGVTDRAFEREERLRTVQLRGAERIVVAGEESIPRRVRECELIDDEPGDRVRRVREAHVVELRARVRLLEISRYFGIVPSRRISAAQMPVRSLSGMLASSLSPNAARISKRLVTGNSPSAEIAPNSNTRVISGVSCAPAG